MSIAKLNVVTAARKVPGRGQCDKCRQKLGVGDSYRYFQAFRGPKYVRCMKPECTPRLSEMESSKLSAVYAAVEDVTAELATAELGISDPENFVSEIQQSLQSVAEVAREIAEEYREASVNPNTGAVFNTDSEERADNLDAAADELESWYPDESEPLACDDHDDPDNDCEDCQELADDWADSAKSSAIELLDNLELG